LKSKKRYLPVLLLLVFAVAALLAVVWGVFLRQPAVVEEGEIYYVQGHLTEMESPLNEKMIAHASDRFSYIYENYLAPEDICPYLAIIPDKNYYLTEDRQPRNLDYDALIAEVREENPYMEYIDITDLLSLEDYYVTDPHWRQETLMDVADRIAENMGAALSDDYDLQSFEEPFYGAYYEDGESRVGADTIYYLDSEILRDCTVSVVGEKMDAAVYDLEKGRTKTPYDLFLSGSVAILNIENPNAVSAKKLVVFRDSFGSSLVPLLVSGYQNITLVDIRYVQSRALGELVDFSGADVLFLYSTLLLNSSMGMK
jgi:hypothetical protein